MPKISAAVLKYVPSGISYAMTTLCGDSNARKPITQLILRRTNYPIGRALGRNSIVGSMSVRITCSRRVRRGMDEVPSLGPMAANTMENGKTIRNTEEDIRCGPMVPHLKVNGRALNSTEEEDTRGPVEVLMKECGLITNVTDGDAILGHRKIPTLVNGSMMRRTDMELISGVIADDTMELGRMISDLAKEPLCGLVLDASTTENGKKTSDTDTESSIGKMEICTKESGEMEDVVAKESSSPPLATSIFKNGTNKTTLIHPTKEISRDLKNHYHLHLRNNSITTTR